MGPRWRQGADGGWQYQGDDGYWYVRDEAGQTPPGTAPAVPPAAATAVPPAAAPAVPPAAATAVPPAAATAVPPAAATAVPPAAATGVARIKKRVVPACVAIAGGVVVAVGAFLPWLTFSNGSGTFTVSAGQINQTATTFTGASDDLGTELLILGIVAAVVGVFRLILRSTSRIRRLFIWRFLERSFVFIALLCGWVLYDGHNQLSDDINRATISASIAYGFWIVLAGAALIFLSGLFLDRGKVFENLIDGILG